LKEKKMAKTLRVEINPEIIKWARETAEYSDEE
jgi:ribosomal protein L24E